MLGGNVLNVKSKPNHNPKPKLLNLIPQPDHKPNPKPKLR